MAVLTRKDEVKPASSFKDEVSETPLKEAEISLTETLIKASIIRKFDFGRYRDADKEKLTTLIHLKIEGWRFPKPAACRQRGPRQAERHFGLCGKGGGGFTDAQRVRLSALLREKVRASPWWPAMSVHDGSNRTIIAW